MFSQDLQPDLPGGLPGAGLRLGGQLLPLGPSFGLGGRGQGFSLPAGLLQQLLSLPGRLLGGLLPEPAGLRTTSTVTTCPSISGCTR